MTAQIIHGECLDAMRHMDSNSVDSIVTDPPYGLSFMGKKWDYDVPNTEVWSECLRVLKPGGHLLAFAGTRTQHRMAVRIEDAGFEIRDMIAWVYGCLDEATEVATEKGVMPYHKTKIGDRVLCYDVEHGEYTYQPILEIVEYDYSDTAFRLVGDFGEQVVSRNHRVIVECGGNEVFQIAETLECEARVPVLESLPALQKALHDAYQGAGRPQKDVQCDLCECVDRRSECGGDAAGTMQGCDDQVRSLRGECVEAKCVAAQGGDTDMQQAVQRCASRRGVGHARAQRAGELVCRVGGGVEDAHDGRIQSGLEGWADISESQGCVCESADQVCALSSADAVDGAVGRLRDGASLGCCAGDRPTSDEIGVCSPHQSRRDGQQAGEPDVVCDQRAAQGVRAWGGHKTAVVRVVPFHYTGKVWCLRVPTGAFVAVRNGVAFPTGNSGFPKSLDVSKAIDKAGGASPREQSEMLRAKRQAAGLSREQVAKVVGCTPSSVRDWEEGRARATGAAIEFIVPSDDYRTKLADLLGYSADERRLIGAAADRRGDGSVYGVGHSGNLRTGGNTDAARQWQGWGTALKPALEPITVARKPLIGTVAENMLAHGTGALNIDGCRVAHSATGLGSVKFFSEGNTPVIEKSPHDLGRWPANLIHDGSEEVLSLFPRAPGQQGRARTDGSAARFFYCAKASRADRNEGCDHIQTKPLHWSSGSANPGSFQSEGTDKTSKNNHPTVKPTDLMRYLCRLVTPAGGIVLDPFMGSGSTGKACMLDGFRFIGIERDAEYVEIAKARIAVTCQQQRLFA